jgi:tetratricopeptide (TPR) repeat protein
MAMRKRPRAARIKMHVWAIILVGIFSLGMTGCGSPSHLPGPPPKKYPVPDDMQAVAAKAADDSSRGDFKDAAAKYEAIADKYPHCSYAWSRLGEAQFRQDRLHPARKAFVHALKLSADDPFTLAHLGMVDSALQRYDEAERLLSKAVKIDDDPEIENDLGSCYSQQGKHDEAVKRFQRAIELFPKFGQAYYNLAEEQARFYPGQMEQARANYQKALNLGVPRNSDLETLLAAKTRTSL